MRRLAARLDIKVPDDRWPALVKAASFTEMRRRAEMVAPDTDNASGRTPKTSSSGGPAGSGAEVIDAELAARTRPGCGSWPRPISPPGCTMGI